MEINELVKLSNNDFYEKIKQMDSSVLIQLIQNEKDRTVKKDCINHIKKCMGKKYAKLVKISVYEKRTHETHYLQIILAITSVILGLINIFYFNMTIFVCLCVVNALLLFITVQRNLLESKSKIYLFIFLLLPIIFCYNVINTEQNNNLNLQIIISSIVFSGIFGFSLIKVFNKIITKQQIKYLKLFNIILVSINTIIGSLLVFINNEDLLKRLKLVIFPVVLGLCVQRVCIEYLNTKIDNNEMK
jgi:hypothetical protein